MRLALLDLDRRQAVHLAMAIRLYRQSAEASEQPWLSQWEQVFTRAAQQPSEPATRPPERSGAPADLSTAEAPLHERQYLSTAEVARVTGLSESTIRRRTTDRSLPSVLIGRRRKVPREALSRFMTATEESTS